MGHSIRSAVGVVGEWRTAQRDPGDRPGGQSDPGTLEAHPRLRVYCPSHTLPRQLIEHLGCTMGPKVGMAAGRLPRPLGAPNVPSGSNKTQW